MTHNCRPKENLNKFPFFSRRLQGFLTAFGLFEGLRARHCGFSTHRLIDAIKVFDHQTDRPPS